MTDNKAQETPSFVKTMERIIQQLENLQHNFEEMQRIIGEMMKDISPTENEDKND